MRLRTLAVLAACLPAPVLLPGAAQAFCGFYAGKADSTLFNKASQVILARDGRRTVLTMQNDYKGEATEFALVVPVPVVLKKDDIRVADPKIFARLDAYSAPRLAEYFDGNPCELSKMRDMARRPSAPAESAGGAPANRAHGVTVEAQYTVGEYDIVILSAEQSDGLETWLTANGYKIPRGASAALRPYVRQNMKFFVAKVNLQEQAKGGFTYLRPLQFRFDSDRFMLPMRLGMLNADGPQDLIVYALTRHGRVESSNYRTVKVPANVTLPTWLRAPGEFPKFYAAMFEDQARRENYRTVFTEYFWDMGWCDPCAADPLSTAELREAGATWITADAPQRRTAGGAQPAMLTRLHLRYTKDSFPEDLALHETRDRANFQTRYVLRHPWKGTVWQCGDAPAYYRSVAERQEQEARALATLTGWDIGTIRRRMSPVPSGWLPR